MKPSCLLLALLSLAPVTPCQNSPGPVPVPILSTAGVHTTSLAIQVEVVDDVATTRLVQRIRNDSRTPMAEAIWVLPLPAGAAADDFRMLVGGVEMTGEVLGADTARGVYEDIVRRKRDPGLLEYVGRGCLRARVFPIPAGEEIGVEVTYRHILTREAGLAHWSFPVQSAGVDGSAPESVTMDVSIRSRRPIKNAFSPLSSVEVVQKDDFAVRASFEGRGHQLPERGLSIFYGLSEQDFGLNLLSHKEQGSEEGTFLMLLSPKRDWGTEVAVKKEITFVLDTSGSMAGEKIEQARASLHFFLSSLRAEDRFNVIPFSTEARPFFEGPVGASPENVGEAIKRIGKVEAVGGTNIADALELGLQRSSGASEHVPIVVFLTDGLPTVGTTDPEDILSAVRDQNTSSSRIFVLGVGNDVNTVLLDTLAAETRGTRNYVDPAENIELKSGALFTKLSNPVLTDLALTVDGMRITRMVPGTLRDLFEGERLEVFGRYEGTGPRAIRLEGTFRGARREYVFEGSFAASGDSELAFLSSLWAQRRVGVLLDAIRRNGEDQELVAEVKRLGSEYDIVTPYTSHLILEDGMQIAANGAPPARRERGRYRGPSDSIPIGGGAGGGSHPTSSGPSAPGSSSGASSTDGVQSKTDSFFLGRAVSEESSSEDRLARIALGLQTAEVLAVDADSEDYTELAAEVLLRFSKAEEEIAMLSSNAIIGAEAVQRSQYLRRLVEGAGQGEGKALRELFSKRVKDKTFHLKKGVWTEEGILLVAGEGEDLKHLKIEAFSPEYFKLVREHPEFLPFLALGERVLVRIGNRVVETIPSRSQPDGDGAVDPSAQR